MSVFMIFCYTFMALAALDALLLNRYLYYASDVIFLNSLLLWFLSGMGFYLLSQRYILGWIICICVAVVYFMFFLKRYFEK